MPHQLFLLFLRKITACELHAHEHLTFALLGILFKVFEHFLPLLVHIFLDRFRFLFLLLFEELFTGDALLVFLQLLLRDAFFTFLALELFFLLLSIMHRVFVIAALEGTTVLINEEL